MSDLRNSVKSRPLEFWFFIFALFYAVTNLVKIGFNLNGGMNVEIFTGGKIIDLFSIMTGFSLISLHNSKKRITSNEVIKIDFIDYLPTIFISVLLVFCVRNIMIETSEKNFIILLIVSTFELFGLSQIGILPYKTYLNDVALKGAINSGAYALLWNKPALYISGTILCSFVLYHLISEHEKLYKYVINPLIILIGFSILNIKDANLDALGFLNYELIRTLTFICIGTLIQPIFDKMKKSDKFDSLKGLLTVLNIVLSLYFIVSFVYGTSWNDSVNLFFLIPFIMVNYIEKDYISDTINHNISLYFGELAIYILGSHTIFVYLLSSLTTRYHYLIVILLYLGICFLLANVFYLVDRFVITPYFRSDDAS